MPKSNFFKVSPVHKPTFRELDYQRQSEQVVEAKSANETLLINTRLTKWTFWVSIIVGIFSVISAFAEVMQLYR